ncbi:Uncharacterised protein [Legionella sainthelensi]|uniref:Uncharacterized protein n=1 Tax=Legionella sainthelensi TaxID=28087 RepID=A0A2H5FKI6_9GAMM|nr:hypothetical protein [Legionella sainthelensi]AUH72067.1 hypothetical protein CAB17_08330 [Legionella sainthelensi]VEB34167.1 Uncharacterised protein [Legionella sainthelensi]
MSISFVYGLFTGCFVTLIGQYFLQKFIIQRGCSEQINTKKFDLDKLFNDYPDFMNAIKDDLTNTHYKDIKEFFVVDKDAILNSSITRLRYELSAEILVALNRLEALGYIEKLKNNCLHYKIMDDFVMQLEAYEIAVKDDQNL